MPVCAVWCHVEKALTSCQIRGNIQHFRNDNVAAVLAKKARSELLESLDSENETPASSVSERKVMRGRQVSERQ